MGAWRSPELDEAAAEALAVLTLYVAEDGVAEADLLLDDLTSSPGGVERLVGGFVSVCATLLVMLEFEGRLEPLEALKEAGRLIAEAGVEPRPLSG